MSVKTKEQHNNKRLLIGIAIILAAIAIIYAYFKYSELYPATEDAYVGANLVNVAPKVNGYIAAINVKTNQRVNQGDLLFSIDPIDYNLAYTQAEKNYISQQAMTAMAVSQMQIQQSQIAKDKQQYDFLQNRANRYAALYNANTIAKQEYQKAQTDFNEIKSQMDMDNRKYKQFAEGAKSAAAKADAAKAQLDSAKSNLDYTKYLSPVTGYVTNMTSLTKGELVAGGQQLFGLVDTKHWWVDANFKETQLARIKAGQVAEIELDMYDHKYKGIVQSLSYASGNTFSLLPAQNATGNWVKVTQRFTVRVMIEDDPKYPLRVGATAKVVIKTL
jgi:membrane fusion protein, multidrug efflux system